MISTCSIVFLAILNYPSITNILAVNQLIRYGEVFDPAITNIFFGTVALRYSGVPLYKRACIPQREKIHLWVKK